MSDPILSVEGLQTFFHTEKGVVRSVAGLTFSMQKGQTLAIVGESGCGKSVTALSVMRLIEPPGSIESGTVVFQGKDLLRLPEAEMRAIRGDRIAMIFQEPMTSLNPVHRVGKQIGETIRLHLGLGRQETKDLTVEMLRRVGIPDPEKRAQAYPHQLSGGMRQRVMIAMALACKPELLIADEPTTALDVTIQAQILDLMIRLREETGASILLITHDLGVVAEMADDVMVMYAGRVVEQAPVRDLFCEPKHPYTVGLIDSVPKIDTPISTDRTLHTIPGTVPSLLSLPPGCPFLDRCARRFEPCAERDPVLLKVAEGHHARCWLYG
jgi:oligopeptide/dipeptide ABC transporter ATP-binding protein